MHHWTDFLSFAVCHQYAMQHTQVQLDPMALMQAIAQAQAEARRLSGIIASPREYNPGLMAGPR